MMTGPKVGKVHWNAVFGVALAWAPERLWGPGGSPYLGTEQWCGYQALVVLQSKGRCT